MSDKKVTTMENRNSNKMGRNKWPVEWEKRSQRKATTKKNWNEIKRFENKSKKILIFLSVEW